MVVTILFCRNRNEDVTAFIILLQSNLNVFGILLSFHLVLVFLATKAVIISFPGLHLPTDGNLVDDIPKMDARFAETLVRKWQNIKSQALGSDHCAAELPEVKAYISLLSFFFSLVSLNVLESYFLYSYKIVCKSMFPKVLLGRFFNLKLVSMYQERIMYIFLEKVNNFRG